MASGAVEMVLGCVFNGSLSLHELTIERRPYHKNCSCALHDLKGVCSSLSNTCSKKNNLSFPKKQMEDHSLEMEKFTRLISADSLLRVPTSSKNRQRIRGFYEFIK
ncbi:hypothetical protein Dsin_015403 [Dipteronia sinensis]|uniref:Uncharacterized protein n=1 Tax=Dipteronia sinensis TaxID=43782 RepID=A0AAE0E4Q7_9ROSI|nr:hypothetical protein Dsin_015403 [Dipteronia sinensis]